MLWFSPDDFGFGIYSIQDIKSFHLHLKPKTQGREKLGGHHRDRGDGEGGIKDGSSRGRDR